MRPALSKGQGEMMMNQTALIPDSEDYGLEKDESHFKTSDV